MQKNRHVAKHTFHDKSRIDRFYIPYYNISVCKIRHEYSLDIQKAASLEKRNVNFIRFKKILSELT